MILAPLSAPLLAGIGIALVTLEALFPAFIIIWFGVGFILSALISLVYPFSDGIYQISLSSILGVLGIMLLRKAIQQNLTKNTPKSTDDFLNVTGVGVISDEGMLKYKGTLWKYTSEQSVEAGEEVNVLNIEENTAIITKKGA